MAEELTLLALPMSPYSMCVKIALAEKGIQYKAVDEDFFGKGKSQMLLQANPVTKQAPVLIHNGNPVWDSLVILEYIEDVWKSQGTQFLPHDPCLRAKARFWANFCNTKFWAKTLKVLFLRGEEQTIAKEETIQLFQLMENEWSKPEYGRPFLFGDKLSMADIVLAPLASVKLSFETMTKLDFFPQAHKCPRMMEWFNAIEKHPSVISSILSPEQALARAKLLFGSK